MGVWRLEGWLRYTGRWQTGRSVDGTTASARGVPRSAPRSNPRLGGSNTSLAPFFNILNFFNAGFCSSQFASSGAVPVVPWGAHGELIVSFYWCLVTKTPLSAPPPDTNDPIASVLVGGCQAPSLAVLLAGDCPGIRALRAPASAFCSSLLIAALQRLAQNPASSSSTRHGQFHAPRRRAAPAGLTGLAALSA